MSKDELNELRQYVEAIQRQLYGEEQLNKGLLESSLDNICWMFGFSPVRGSMNIERSVTGWTLNHLVEYNRIFEDLIK